MMDVFTVYHALGGLFLGLILFFLHKKRRRFNKRLFAAFFAMPVGWEIAEQNILASWTNFLPVETLANSLFDIIVVWAVMVATFIVVRRL